MAKAKGTSVAGGALSGAGTGAAVGAAFGGVGAVPGAIIGGVAGAAIPLLMGDGSEESDMERQARLEALSIISQIQSPELQQIALEQYASQGEITPEFEKEILQQDTAMKGISLDPRLKQAQMEALESLRDVGRTGLRAEDRLALEEIQMKAARDAQAQREAILQSRQMRGLAGGGDELVAALQAGQSEANTGRLAGLQQAAMAQRAALQGIAQGGQLGGQIRQQEYGEQSDLAKATDEINRFNTGAQIARQQRNINRTNEAQQANLANKQQLSNLNVGLANQQNIYNKQTLPQQQFENRFKVAGSKANVLTGHGAYLGDVAANKQAGQQALFEGAGQTALAGAQMKRVMAADKRDEERLAIENKRADAAALRDEERLAIEKKKAGLA
jgi:hypothetical protein